MIKPAVGAREPAQSDYNLAHAIYRHGMARPDTLAVAFEGRSLSYGQLAAQAVRVAHCLAGHRTWKWRQGKPPRVGILASRSLDACVAVAGASWAGATYVPLGPKLPEARLLKIIGVRPFGCHCRRNRHVAADAAPARQLPLPCDAYRPSTRTGAGKGRHGRRQNAGPPMYRLGPWHDDPVTYTTPKVRNARNSASSTFAKRAITSSVC